jgi:SAM-dependent methyltransferase
MSGGIKIGGQPSSSAAATACAPLKLTQGKNTLISTNPEAEGLDALLTAFFLETLGGKAEVSGKVANLVTNYTFAPWPQFINLTDPAVLQPLLAQNFQTKAHLSMAVGMAKRRYEVGRVAIGGVSAPRGYSFPMNPEILTYAMRLAKGETVLEIAAARGENAILLALSGASKVWVNEIDPTEMQQFRNLQKMLPSDVRGNMEPIEGNCFTLLEAKPELAHRVGLVVCRNLIHFFNDTQQASFFQLLKNLLRPGGRAIFTVNSSYPFGESSEVLKANPEVTSFRKLTVLIYDNSQDWPIGQLCEEMSPCSGKLVSYEYEKFDIYTVVPGNMWNINEAIIAAKVPPPFAKKLGQAMLRYADTINSIESGRITVLINTIRSYTKQNLNALFSKQGFEVEQTFAVGANGHLINDADLAVKGGQVGVVVQAPAT